VKGVPLLDFRDYPRMLVLLPEGLALMSLYFQIRLPPPSRHLQSKSKRDRNLRSAPQACERWTLKILTQIQADIALQVCCTLYLYPVPSSPRSLMLCFVTLIAIPKYPDAFHREFG
jgi:hypothetical protein